MPAFDDLDSDGAHLYLQDENSSFVGPLSCEGPRGHRPLLASLKSVIQTERTARGWATRGQLSPAVGGGKRGKDEQRLTLTTPASLCPAFIGSFNSLFSPEGYRTEPCTFPRSVDREIEIQRVDRISCPEHSVR